MYDAKTQKLIYSERIKGVGAQSQNLYIETTKNFHKKFNDLVIGKVKPEKKVDKNEVWELGNVSEKRVENGISFVFCTYINKNPQSHFEQKTL